MSWLHWLYSLISSDLFWGGIGGLFATVLVRRENAERPIFERQRISYAADFWNIAMGIALVGAYLKSGATLNALHALFTGGSAPLILRAGFGAAARSLPGTKEPE